MLVEPRQFGSLQPMFSRVCIVLQLIAAACCFGAERVFDWRDTKLNERPASFESVLSGRGLPGDWKIIFDEAPSPFGEISLKGAGRNVRPVLAQLSRDRTDERYPMLVLDEAFTDFALKTEFKIVDGMEEQMAGIAFRIQDERNYYYIRASALGQNVNFFKVQNGQLIGPVGTKAEVQKGAWQELSIQCRGNEIRWSLATAGVTNAGMTLRDNTYSDGKIAFWTKSDSVSYFGETRITYTPRENLAQLLVRDTIKKYPRLRSIRIFAPSAIGATATNTVKIVASTDPAEVGKPAQKEAVDVIARGVIYHGEDKGNVLVTMPLRDSNGESVAAVKLVMKSFAGQTEKNAIARALPIVKEMQARIRDLNELIQ